MSTVKQQLTDKIVDAIHYNDVIQAVEESIADDVKPTFIKGLARIAKIILARPYTKYGWLLAIYNALGKVEDRNLIVYYNSEDLRWTTAVLIHEVVHLALDIKRSNTIDTVVDEALAYTATFKSEQLRNLYKPGILQAIKFLSSCVNPYEDYELINIVIPRILAYRLTHYNYQQLVTNLIEKPMNIFRLWLKTRPSETELRALATALNVANIAVDKVSALGYVCRESTFKEVQNKTKYVPEGVDKYFIEMIQILREAARNKHRYREVLRPWWDKLKDLEDEVIAFIELYGNNITELY